MLVNIVLLQKWLLRCNRRFRTLTPLTAPLFADGTRAVVKGDVGGRCREWGERDVFAAGHPQRCGTERTG